MPLGVIVNCSCIALGGVMGTFFGKVIPERVKNNLTGLFGICSITMGIVNIIKVDALPPTILAILLGAALGALFYLEERVSSLGMKLQKPIEKVFTTKNSDLTEEEFLSEYVTLIVLFCASGTGIFGSLQSGMNGDHSILYTKSVLDFFTALIFAARLGLPVSMIALPQIAIMLLLFFSAELLMPLMSPSMMADFSACGGALMLATGLKMSKIKDFPLANILPAMVLILPFSYFWGLLF